MKGPLGKVSPEPNLAPHKQLCLFSFALVKLVLDIGKLLIRLL